MAEAVTSERSGRGASVDGEPTLLVKDSILFTSAAEKPRFLNWRHMTRHPT
jgi:hypothetical protein